MTPSLAAIVALPLLLSWVPVLAARVGRRAAAWSAALVFALPLALALTHAGDVFAGRELHVSWSWLAAAQLRLSFRLDGLAFLFVVLIAGIGLLVVLYAAYYLSERDPFGRFFAYLSLFAGAMLGLVLSDNAIALVVFWELTSLSSFLLIGYWNHRADARRGARMALAITGAGGLCLLAGMLLLGQVAGTYELSEMAARRDAIHASPLYLPILALVLLGAFTKSAQFPFHFWLPSAMAAPTPVSAYLHSATMVKAGVFLLARMYETLAGSEAWFWTVSITGAVTMLFAAVTALFKHDLKGLLAYSTISQLGLITLLFGLGTSLSAVAAVFHIVNHATFKASLFMAAGIIDHETGSRDMRKLSGLWKYMPYTAVLAMISASAMAGVPLANGFLSKEMFFAETLSVPGSGPLATVFPILAIVAGMFSVAYSVRFIHDVFFAGEPVGLPRQPHEPPRYMKIPVEVLAAACLAAGMFPEVVVGPVLDVAARATLGAPPAPYSLAIWHGFNVPLAMSAIALAGGAAIYFSLQRFYRLHDYAHSPFGADWAWHRTLHGLIDAASALTRALENGSLQRYLALTVATAVALAAFPFLGRGYDAGRATLPADGVAMAAWLLLVAGTLATVLLHRRRFDALISLGLVGLVSTLAFVRFSAPDLAMTQVAVEAVTILLLLLALHYLPQRSPVESSRARRARDAVMAIAAGVGTTAIVHAVLTRPADTISGFFLEKSVPEGGGSNVVNVILVDFRGFDTFGEIIVLAIAALGIHAMLDDFVPGRRRADEAGRPFDAVVHPTMLEVLSRVLLPLALLVSAYIFLRGHNLPGGGFIAGLTSAIALILLYAANGIDWATGRMRFDYTRVIGAGVIVAVATGAASWAFGRPFLTSTTGHPVVPLLGEVPLASAMAFDLGVYLTVVGVVMLVLQRLGAIGSSAARRSDASHE